MKKFLFPIIFTIALSLSSCSSKWAVTSTSNNRNVVTLVPSSDKQVNRLISEAHKWEGTPYVYGGHTRKKGTDCSGMIMELFLDVYNLKLPRSSAMQCEFSLPVKYKELRPGDLVFFTTNKTSSRVNHVGLYIGNNRMIHASGSKGVMESNLTEKYWQQHYYRSGRVIESGKRKVNEQPAQIQVPSISIHDLQKLYDALDEQIDSIYVSDPAIFD